MADNPNPAPARRNKRSSEAISPIKPTQTPSRKRPQKKARFSDTDLPNATTTGVTPFVGKVSLNTPKRRASTPAPSRFQETVQFTPFRQCLDDRVKRRIRRHGLSEEMNNYYVDKKANAELRRQLAAKDAELKQLKVELEQNRQSEHTVENDLQSSQARVDEVEAEIEQLRHSFGLFNDEPVPQPDTPILEADEHEDSGIGFQIYEDEEEQGPMSDDIDALAVGLDFQAARQGKEALFRSSQGSVSNSFHFEDSPVRQKLPRSLPQSPESLRQQLSKELSEALSRAEDAEVALLALTTEIKALGFSPNSEDASECVSTIAQHFRQMRLDLERAVPGEIVGSFDNARLMPEIVKKLKLVAQHVRDRETELKSMRGQQRALKGNFDHAIAAAAKAESKVKDLELALDKNAEEMLDLRMRAQALERELQEQESSNRSLIVAIEKYRLEATRLEDLVRLIEAEHATRIEEIKKATVAEFNQTISDMEAKAAAETTGRRAAEESAVDRLRKINDLESALSKARQHSEDVKEKLKSLEAQLQRSTSDHEEEVGNLNSRISSLSTALASANAEVEKLKKINGKLEARYLNEVEQGAQTVERMQSEYIRAVAKMAEEKKRYVRGAKVRYANWGIESDELTSDDLPVTPASMVRFADEDDQLPGTVEISRGRERRSRSKGTGEGIMKKRRRYDSGIGMDSMSEAEESVDDDGMLTPGLGSEADIEQDTDVELPAMA